MKKLIVVLLLSFVTAICQSTEASAQSRLTPLLDTNTNGETNTLTTSLLTNGHGDIALQYVGTKLSGTISGKVYLQGSVDGTNFVTIDSLVLADVTTNTKIFDLSAKKRAKYQFSIVTSGSQSLVNKGYFLQILKP